VSTELNRDRRRSSSSFREQSTPAGPLGPKPSWSHRPPSAGGLERQNLIIETGARRAFGEPDSEGPSHRPPFRCKLDMPLFSRDRQHGQSYARIAKGHQKSRTATVQRVLREHATTTEEQPHDPNPFSFCLSGLAVIVVLAILICLLSRGARSPALTARLQIRFRPCSRFLASTEKDRNRSLHDQAAAFSTTPTSEFSNCNKRGLKPARQNPTKINGRIYPIRPRVHKVWVKGHAGIRQKRKQTRAPPPKLDFRNLSHISEKSSLGFLTNRS